MPDEMIDIMASLTLIMNEETARLQGQRPGLDLAELAVAKARLVGKLEELLARHSRQQPQWTEEMGPETREQLTACLADLREASESNADILARQIELSMGIMVAIADEARRLVGNRTYTYGARGDLNHLDLATPISFNTEY